MRSPEMRKKRRLRSVCAPQSRSAGTSIVPKLSFSTREPLIAASMLLLVADLGVHLGHVDRLRLRDHLLERGAGQSARLLKQDHFLAEHHQGRDRADAEGAGELLLLIGVDLGEHHVLVRLRGLLVDRRKTLARTAPRRPEVDDHHRVVANRLLEVLLGELDGGHGGPFKKGGQCTLETLMYVGRFAPSPTGPLHFGSLAAALASWLDARAACGRWLLRIEDLDAPRTQPGAADEILRALERLGLGWDGEVSQQSKRARFYDSALHALDGSTYWCACSRREIADSSLGLAADGAQIYPGTCRSGIDAHKPRRALRLRTNGEPIRFVDRVQGPQQQNLERNVGDFVLYRGDAHYAYQLAVVVDDARQGVTDVVRGADLLDSTPRQIYLQRLLGYPTPRYLHVPAAVNAAGEKLSKQTGAAPIDSSPGWIRKALAFLGQPETDELADAARNWNAALIPARRAQAAGP